MMKTLLIVLLLCIPLAALAGALPQSSIAPNPAYSDKLSLGTKGTASYSVAFRDAVRFKAATATGTAVTVKVFFNEDETKVYPTSEDTYSFERGKVSSIAFRAYSSQTPTFVHIWGQ
jgi:hypothetical protein